MIKRMRLKFFFVTSSIVLGMMIIFCGSILISTHIRDNTMENENLQRTADMIERGRPESESAQGQEDMPNFILNNRIIAAKVENGSVTYFESRAYDSEQIKECIDKILANRSLKGFKVLIRNTESGKIITAMDTSIEDEAFGRLTLTVISIGGAGLALLLALAWLLSFWIVKPAAASLEKQRRFISEASHELRTPLTIISAGVELMEGKKQDDNTKKWLFDIKEQTKRMTAMTADLLALSRLNETHKIIRTELNMSQIVLSDVLAFESVAFEQGKEIVCDIEEELMYKGDAKSVSQAIGILCDNAIKHSDDQTIIKVALKRQSSKLYLTVSNTAGTLSHDEIPFLFERFYRGKESRAKILGTGLGLAILKNLADKNGWKISAKTNSDKIIFTLSF